VRPHVGRFANDALIDAVAQALSDVLEQLGLQLENKAAAAE
jgi:hypothetical protein